MLKPTHFLVIAMLVTTFSGAAHADGLTKARNVVDNIREADPPSVSTSTKESPVGQPVSDYKPQQHFGKVTEPPSPTSSYNPQNDPDVERGYQEHQREHGR